LKLGYNWMSEHLETAAELHECADVQGCAAIPQLEALGNEIKLLAAKVQSVHLESLRKAYTDKLVALETLQAASSLVRGLPLVCTEPLKRFLFWFVVWWVACVVSNVCSCAEPSTLSRRKPPIRAMM
jgi:hypothetical protein